MKIILHILIVGLLTMVTQIGGLVWIINFSIFRWWVKGKRRSVKLMVFLVFYLASTFLIVPSLAELNGRVALPLLKSGNLIPHNIITPLLNRNYVRPQLRKQLENIADRMREGNEQLKLSYLDANFPFIDGFPLLPHLSHHDGRKVDLSFYYTERKKVGNKKPSNSGYGKFVEPKEGEYEQMKVCKTKGYWQYDFTKFLTLGGRSDLEFDVSNTKRLCDLITNDRRTQKLFIEPHLKTRLKLTSAKVRFHGCQAVRHDDHIHFQINQ